MSNNDQTAESEFLTSEEFIALGMTANLFAFIATRVIGNDITREADLTEFSLHVHAIQNMILSQAAARAYPDKFRLLGERTTNIQ